MKRLPVASAAIATCLCLVLFLYIAVVSFAFSPGAYIREPAPFDAMADALTAYLRGDADGLPSALFTERERLHMVDVLGLFQGARALATLCLLGCILLGALACRSSGRRALGAGILIGIGAFALIVLGIALWALVDFQGWFVTMHHIAFDNDLWLLDPAESMLIRMMPLDFFIGAVRTIALRFALMALALAAAGLLLRRRTHTKEELPCDMNS